MIAGNKCVFCFSWWRKRTRSLSLASRIQSSTRSTTNGSVQNQTEPDSYPLKWNHFSRFPRSSISFYRPIPATSPRARSHHLSRRIGWERKAADKVIIGLEQSVAASTNINIQSLILIFNLRGWLLDRQRGAYDGALRQGLGGVGARWAQPT